MRRHGDHEFHVVRAELLSLRGRKCQSAEFLPGYRDWKYVGAMRSPKLCLRCQLRNPRKLSLEVGNVYRFLFVDCSSNSAPYMRNLSANVDVMSLRTSIKCDETNRVPIVGQQAKAHRDESDK